MPTYSNQEMSDFGHCFYCTIFFALECICSFEADNSILMLFVSSKKWLNIVLYLGSSLF